MTIQYLFWFVVVVCIGVSVYAYIFFNKYQRSIKKIEAFVWKQQTMINLKDKIIASNEQAVKELCDKRNYKQVLQDLQARNIPLYEDLKKVIND